MKIALVIAGGSGRRMGADIPKQFINVLGKPVLAYTLESFQNHPKIDAIAVVCIEGWEDTIQTYPQKYGINKLKWVFRGGSTGQESIRNGIYGLQETCSAEDLVIIHDGVRPLVDEGILASVISTAERCGNAVSSMPYNEQIFLMDDAVSTTRYIPRETLRRVVTPQAYTYEKLLWAYKKAFSENIGISASSYTNTMMVELGERLYFADGSDKNIKLTTPDNLEMFEAYLRREASKLP